MPNNPVQIILNDEAFLRAPEPGMGGPGKDFYEDRDKTFQAHREMLVDSIDQVERAIDEADFGPATCLKVQLQDQAIAKSHRPNQKLFLKSQFPCVGAGRIGELYYYAPKIYLPMLRQRILRAEDVVGVHTTAEGEVRKVPTRHRSEVGAIESIVVAPSADKRIFSGSDALEMFASSNTISGYQIELFGTSPQSEITDDPLARHELTKSLLKTLNELGPGTRIFPSVRLGGTSVLEMQLTHSDQDAIVIYNDRSNILPVGIDSTDSFHKAPVDPNPERHEQALRTLARHPLVRFIHPPVQLCVSGHDAPLPQGEPTELPAAVKVPKPASETIYPMVGVIDTGISSILDPWVIGRFDYLQQSECNPGHGTAVAGLLTAGQAMNNPNVVAEPDGCKIYDIPLYPKNFSGQYPNGFADFLEEMEQAIIEARDCGVRVFNLSINVKAAVHLYGRYAATLDRISAMHDALIVNSAGNLPFGQPRIP